MANSVGFFYTPDDLIDPETGEKFSTAFRPTAEVRFQYKHGPLTNIVLCLVDSGSDFNLFPMGLALKLGINLHKTKPVKLFGIGDAEVKGYLSEINIYVGSNKYTTKAYFSNEQQTPLLGMDGFFNLFKSLNFTSGNKCLDLIF